MVYSLGTAPTKISYGSGDSDTAGEELKDNGAIAAQGLRGGVQDYVTRTKARNPKTQFVKGIKQRSWQCGKLPDRESGQHDSVPVRPRAGGTQLVSIKQDRGVQRPEDTKALHEESGQG